MTSAVAFAPTHAPASAPTRRYAWYALSVLSFINLVNYLDRSVLAPVIGSIKEAFQIGDSEAGFLTTAFFWVYTIVSPLSGYLGDRVSRRVLIVFGIGLWSMATAASAFAQTYEQLWIARALTGVGEAGYGIVAPAFLGDLFSKESRARTLAIFYLALPVGTAAGFAYGGFMVEHFGHPAGAPHRGWLCAIGIHDGWRYAFLFGGLPGLFLAALAWFLREPARGAMEGGDAGTPAAPFRWASVLELLRTRSFVVNVAATTAMTFAIGGLQQWVPEFVQRVHGYSPKEAGVLVGVVVAGAGTLGTISGGFLADFARRWTQSSHFVVPGIALCTSAGVLALAVLAADRVAFWTFGGISIFLLFCNSGPLNAAILNVSMPAVRATAFAITIFTIHLFGDALSPAVIGEVSDHLASTRGSAESLRMAFLIAPPVMLLGGLLLLAFAKHLPRDVESVDRRVRESATTPA